MVKIILLVVVCLVAIILIYAATKPSSFSITRTIKINAPAEKIIAELIDFKRWKDWSPWEGKDPAMQRSFSGAQSGVGSVYEWDGNKDVGQGRMEILEVIPSQKVLIQLDFFKPFEAHNFAEFTLTQDSNGTLIVWEMRGPQNYMGKVVSVFMNIDKMVGADFEAGLAKLKAVSETH